MLEDTFHRLAYKMDINVLQNEDIEMSGNRK